MARQKPPEEPADDVPGWVMTFSDVITLLMTFFILLLTFATNQPETLDRMQTAMFGGGGAQGMAGQIEGMERDGLVMRKRARTGRMHQKGSEMPPIHSDPALEALGDGIAGLEESEDRVISTTHQIEMQLKSLISPAGEVTATGKQQLKMVAIQMRKMPLRLDIVVGGETTLAQGIALAKHMTDVERVPQHLVGVAVSPQRIKTERVMLVLDLQELNRGP